MERLASGVILWVPGWILGRGWPEAIAVVGLAFLRVTQNLVSVVDLALVERMV